jgi:hypothetical protein
MEVHDDDYGGDLGKDGHVCFKSIDWRGYQGDWTTLEVRSFKGKNSCRSMKA